MALEVHQDVSLAPLTTLRIGGRAKFFVHAKTQEDVAEALNYAAVRGLDIFVLGGGSNVLVSDGGFDGLVLHVSILGKESTYMGNWVGLTIGAGEDWDSLVELCVSRGFAGVECLSGIPGTVGGTPIQNVGAYGQEVSETILSVHCLERSTGEFVVLEKEQCGFSYRTSVFNTTERDRYVVLQVAFMLRIADEPKVVYRELVEHFAGRTPALQEVRDTVILIRKQKSMVIDAADPNSRSAGSFFKNPIVDKSRLEEIESQLGKVPYFDFDERVKIPAAWLIEKAGFPKGYVLGNAGISSNHTLALINRGSAKAADIVALKRVIQDSVMEKFGIELVPEPVFVGF
jgi:UDP-N-acetylmuramate dehydrogenase